MRAKHQDSRARITRDQQRSGEAKLSGAVAGSPYSGYLKKVLSDGYWAGFPRVVSTAPNLAAQDPFASPRRPQYSGLTPLQPNTSPRRDSTIHVILPPSGALASLARQSNRLLQSATVLTLSFVGQLFSSGHDLALNCLRIFCQVKTNLDMYSLRFLS